jgi:hypothetical protein
MMLVRTLLFLCLCLVCAFPCVVKAESAAQFTAEPATEPAADWKGKADSSEFSFGGMMGAGLIDAAVGVTGFTVVGTASKKILSGGFVPDINNPVSIEILVGPTFLPKITGVIYSAHLRWDFVKDSLWTFYALGGWSGITVDPLSRTKTFITLPRFGVGVFLKIFSQLSFRGELSHDFIGVGVNFSI